MTWWFAKVLIKLFIFFTISNHIILTESSKLNILDYVKRNFYNFHTNNSKDFIFTLSNSSNRNNNRISFKSNQVDCFGLGKRLAGILEWFFLNNSNGTNTLDVQFFLSSRRQPKRVEVMTGKQFGLEWTDFQIERPTIIIVHGFLSHGQELWINEMEKSFLLWNDVNIIVVDWSAGGNTWNYYKAAVNTKIIGYQIARFLEYITNATSAQNDFNNWGQLHLVGHSLGAHICGFAAKELKRKQNKWKILRITGLDPAQPCFRNVDSSMKLHKSDASFVDVIHTNGRLLSKIGLGLPEPIGHIDFYPNGGRTQPGCKINSSYFEYLPIPLGEINNAICSHGRSYVYLTESLISEVKQNCTFWAHHWNLSYKNLLQVVTESCDKNTCTEMGINAIKYSHRGIFFVATSDTPPFCINDTRIIAELLIEMKKDFSDEFYDQDE